MGMAEWVAIGLAVMGIVFGVIGKLLGNKDAAQEKEMIAQAAQIKLLFEKHDSDVIALNEVKMTLAGKHYERTELDIKFEKLDATIKDGFKVLSADIKEMTVSINDTYKDHIKTHHSKDNQ